jgi:hypothetical protein
MHLSDVCTIQIGYTARARFETAADGGVLTVQLRDFPAKGGIQPGLLTRAHLHEHPDRYLVTNGDVLFRSRGDRNIAAALDERFTEPAVAVSPIMILRADPARVLAPYLAWAINQPDAQRHFEAAARGTSLRMVPKSSLGELDIDVPDLDTQHRIVAVAALAEQEEALSLRLAALKRALADRLLAGLASGAAMAATHKGNRT